jgi:3-hydroxybutyryl-CoA dehydrogenase
MTLLIIGSEQALNESRLKFGPAHQYLHAAGNEPVSDFPAAEVVFDFRGTSPSQVLDNYLGQQYKAVFVNSVVHPLHTWVPTGAKKGPLLIGFNGLPTCINRPVLEVALLSSEGKPQLKEVCDSLGTEFALVKDQAGMVTARVLAMIINEAYLTLEEGTASRDDIDKAMKLGTNYPLGPFEWANRIGLANIVAILRAVKKESGEERFPICSLLMQQAQTTPQPASTS